jgi:hypothetical protein
MENNQKTKISRQNDGDDSLTTSLTTSDYALTTTADSAPEVITSVDHLRAEAKKELQSLQNAIENDIQNAVQRAIRCGQILTTVRETFPKRASKGEGFYDWVEENLGYAKSTAIGYMRAYRDQHLHLDPTRKEVNASMTVSKLFGYGKKQGELVEANDDNDDDEADILRMVFTLTDAQRKRAIEYARWFNHDPNADPSPRMVKYAERMIWQKGQTTKSKPKMEAGSTSIKRTIRYNPEVDGYIQHVAKKTTRSYSQVNEELTTIGLRRFKTRYELK